MKVLVHDGIGIWLAARRLHRGRFVWASVNDNPILSLSSTQLDTLVLACRGSASVKRVSSPWYER